MRTAIFLSCCFMTGVLHAQTNFHDDPAQVKLVTTDITHFWQMMKELPNAANKNDSIAVIEKLYVNHASAGLSEIMKKKRYSFSAEDLFYTIRRYGNYLKTLETSSQKIESYKPSVMQSFRQLKAIYPEAKFPDFYFAFGVFGSGGTGVPSGMFIGAEIEAADTHSPLGDLPLYLQAGAKTVDKIRFICSHELIHFQQTDQPNDLLSASIHEGACDFIGGLISGGLINEYQHQYGDAREAAIWKKFALEMNGSDFSNWLYNGGTIKNFPADMGYYVGYKICKAYYEQAVDKHAALTEILNVKDYRKLLAESGYAEKMEALYEPLQNESYKVNLTIEPETRIMRVNADIAFKTKIPVNDTAALLLHKDAVIRSLKLNGASVPFSWQTSDTAANRFMPESRKLLIVLDHLAKGRHSLAIDYETKFTELKQNNSSFTKDWISLASYSSWYPVNYDWGNFIFEITASLPAKYKLTGNGTVTRSGDEWKITQPLASSDMVLVASEELQTKNFADGNTRISFNYLDYSTSQADSFINTTANIYQFFSASFGAANANLNVVATPRKGGSAFSRNGFFYMQTKGQEPDNIYKTIGHEVAHFWWGKSNSETWEDWLNESFAEFSTLLFIRKQKGDEAYLKILERYKAATKDLPSIWGMDRSDKNASLMLYYKGSIILSSFMDKVGEKTFLQLLHDVHSSEIKETGALIKLIQKNISDEAAQYLIRLLKQ